MTLQIVRERDRELDAVRARTEALRQARLAKQAAEAVAPKPVDVAKAERRTAFEARRNEGRTNAENLFDNFDRLGGDDACHIWTGNTSWSESIGYEYPIFRQIGFPSGAPAQRIMLFLTYGIKVPDDCYVTPLCRDHMCCNERHLVIATKRWGIERRLSEGKAPAAFFNCDGGHDDDQVSGQQAQDRQGNPADHIG